MTIIIESGATKSDWRLIGDDGKQISRKLHPGMNVSTMSPDVIKGILSDALAEAGDVKGVSFYMYAAGVVTDAIRQDLKSFVLQKTGAGDFDLQNDLVGAARGVLGHDSGIAAIMGTGSNTCFYDGTKVSQKVYSGGYVIGDDGSAATLGRLFLTDFIKNRIPSDVAGDFASKFDASYAGIVENVYRSASPSGYLGTLAPFILSHYDNPHIRKMVDGNFQRFIDLSLKQYDTDEYPVGIVGGFGYACRDIFEPLCEASGLKVKCFLREPIEGLIEYHRK